MSIESRNMFVAGSQIDIPFHYFASALAPVLQFWWYRE